MGTRLYPKTQDAATLEAFAHVPKGTAKRLERLEAGFKIIREALFDEFNKRLAELKTAGINSVGDDPTIKQLRAADDALDTAEYEAIQFDTDVSRFHSFLLFGWGRVNCGAAWFEESNLDPYCGSTSDPEKVKHIASCSMLSEGTIAILNETGGICWG